MSLKHGLLGLLNYGSMTGYELNKAFKDSLSFFWQAKASQIYRELDTMEKCGWLVSELVYQEDRPNKRVYSVTDSGKQEFFNWLSVPETDIVGAMRIKSAFLMRVFFAGETTVEESIALLNAYREKCIESSLYLCTAHDAIAEYKKTAGGDAKARYWKIAALYGEAFNSTGIKWAEEAIAVLEGEE